MLSAIWLRRFQYLFLAIIVTTVGFSLYQWNASRAALTVTQKSAPGNGLVGYWSFDDGAGTQAGDASGNNNTGILTNGPTWVTGKLGKAINFDGVNDYVDVPHSSSICPTSISVTMWMKLTSLTTTTVSSGATINEMYPLSKGRSDQEDSYTFYKGGDQIMYFSVNSHTHTAAATTAVAAGKWYLVTGIYDGSNIKIYVNGNLEGTTAYVGGAVSCDASALIVGRRSLLIPYNAYFNGQIDEVRIYNRALSGTEIANLYNLGIEKLNVSATPSPASGLVGWWTFDGNDMTNTLAYDRSGQGNDGTLTNGPTKTIGYLGQGLSFDGVNDYVQASNAASLQFANATSITLSAWINPSQVTSYGTVLIKGRDTDNNEANYALRQSSTGKKLEFYYNESGNTNYHVWTTTSDVFLTANQWYHVAVTYTFGTGASIKAYINGENYTGSWIGGTGNSAPDVSTQVLTIGRKKSVTGGAELFTGSIDDVRIYNTALTASQVADLYNGGKVVLNSTKKIYITTVGAGTFTAPADWPGVADKVEVIGGGAAGGYGDYWSQHPGSGGGGGAYAKKLNVSISNGASLQVGSGGLSSAGAGGDTWIVSTGTVKAAGAPAHAYDVAGTGGAAGSSVGDIVYSGGDGGSTSNVYSIGGGGGGGAGGPGGIGKNGGYAANLGCCNGGGGAGGGGAGGGSSTAGSDSTNGGPAGTGAPGGTAQDGAAGGAAGGANGFHGSGGGGGGNGTIGGQGGVGVEWDSTHGAGGGGGGGGAGGSSYDGGAGGAGGSYGGGGGGGGQDGHRLPDYNDGGAGGQGIIVITYTPL